MKKEEVKIGNIPSIIWGEKSNKVYIAVHGNMSNKEEEVIRILAEKTIKRGYQIISFDLPEHGERQEDKDYQCKVQNCVKDLEQIMKYAKEKYEEINLWACSMGAYFSLLEYKDEKIEKCLFLSPVVNMKSIIDNMMKWSNTTEEELKEKKKIKTDFGQTLYWDYYEYVKNNPITKWNAKTNILYGSKDNIQNEKIIGDFCKDFNCKLTVLENGEHYFHTDEQIKAYKKWLDEMLGKQ